MPELMLISLVPTEAVAYRLVGLMAGLALIFGWVLLWPLRNFRSRLDRIAARLEDVGTDSGADPEEVREVVERDFGDFLAAWEDAAVEIGGDRFSSARFEDFVDPSQAYGKLARARFELVRPVAPILLALGILFTFLGLTLGIQGLETGTSDALSRGIDALLGGMFFAFATSIAGIFLSILWILASRWQLGRLDRSIEVLGDVVHALFPWRPSAELYARQALETAEAANEIMRRQLEQEQEQADTLRTLAVDLATELSGAFRESLGAEVVPALEAVRTSLSEFMEKQAEAQEDSLGEMVASFREGLTDHLTTHVNAIAGAMAEANQNIERFHETLGPTLEQLAQMSELQTELLEVTTSSSLAFNESVDGLQEIHKAIGEAVESYGDAAEAAKGMAATARAESEALSGVNASLRGELAQHLDRVAEQTRLLSESSQRFESATGEMVPRLESAVTEFTGLAADKLHEVFKVFDQEVASVIDRFSATLNDIQHALEEMTPNTAQLGAHVNDLKPLTVEARKQLKELAIVVADSRSATVELAGSINGFGQWLKRARDENGIGG